MVVPQPRGIELCSGGDPEHEVAFHEIDAVASASSAMMMLASAFGFTGEY